VKLCKKGNEMSSDETTQEPLPAWLEVGDAETDRAAQPDAVKALYKTLQRGVVSECERARKRLRGGYAEYVRGLKDARDALAPSRKFKEWCLAWGFNYGTVCNTLSLAGKLATNDSEGVS